MGRALCPKRNRAGAHLSAPAFRSRVAVVLVALAAALALGAAWNGAPAPVTWLWVLACVVGEAMWLRLPAGKATLSMGSCFNVAAFMVLSPHEAMLATAVATLIAEAAIMRKPAVRVLYNAAHTVLAVGAAAALYHAWGGGGAWTLAAAAGAAAAYYALNRLAVSFAVALESGTTPLAAFARNFAHRYEAASSGAVFSLGILLGLFAAAGNPWHVALIVLPLFVAFDGYRRFSERPRFGAVPDRESEREAA